MKVFFKKCVTNYPGMNYPEMNCPGMNYSDMKYPGINCPEMNYVGMNDPDMNNQTTQIAYFEQPIFWEKSLTA